MRFVLAEDFDFGFEFDAAFGAGFLLDGFDELEDFRWRSRRPG